MNYRQWKKNYKKKHGVNPPLELDKRKQAKVMKRALKIIQETDWQQIANDVVSSFRLAMRNMIQALGEGLMNAGKAMEDIAKQLM